MGGQGRSSRTFFRRRDVADNAVDRRPCDSGQPVDLTLADARVESSLNDLVTPARYGVLLNGPRGKHLPSLPDSQLWHVSDATFM
jgi:hypothetical protein